jgi:hypothetical protein
LIYELYVEIADKMKYLRTNKKTGSFGRDHKDPRGQGIMGSSEMLKNYKELKVWQKSISFF